MATFLDCWANEQSAQVQARVADLPIQATVRLPKWRKVAKIATFLLIPPMVPFLAAGRSVVTNRSPVMTRTFVWLTIIRSIA